MNIYLLGMMGSGKSTVGKSLSQYMDKPFIDLDLEIEEQLVNDSYDFLSLGTHFERADFTARIIDVKYFILLPNSELIGKDYDNFQWSLLLRAVSSFRGFKWAYGNSDIDYYKIIDFLILNLI